MFCTVRLTILATMALPMALSLLHKGQIRRIDHTRLLCRDSSSVIVHLSSSDALTSGEAKALSAIETYGANRMAQKAMNVLKQMRKSDIEFRSGNHQGVLPLQFQGHKQVRIPQLQSKLD